MASPPSASSSLSKFTVTQEQFNIFHNIDRLLFSRLVLTLCRDPYQSMQVMALWMWLEQTGLCRDLVDNLLTLPDNLLTSLAGEAVLCLNFIQSEDLPRPFEEINVPFTQSMTKSRVSLRFFRDNRFHALLGITRNVKEVCVRAFEDILQLHAMEKNKAVSDHKSGENLGEEVVMKQQQQSQLGGFAPLISPVLTAVMYHNIGAGVGDHIGHHQMVNISPYYNQCYDVYDAAVQRKLLNGDTGEILRGLQISDDHEQQEKDQVPPDERTIFLTFSKGYPISESDIRDFFTRIYGECIEAIYMHEVAPGEQPLYARLVVNSWAASEEILKSKSKAKFSINGKHVWARKYVRKNNKSPTQSSSPIAMTLPLPS